MRIGYIGNFRPSHSTENHIAATLEGMGHSVDRLQEDRFPLEVDPNHALILWTRTWPNLAVNHFIELSKRRGIPTVSYHLDLYIGISREQEMGSDPFWRTDYVFTPDGDPKSAKIFKKMGVNHHWLPAGVYKPECKKGDWKRKYAHDVVFIGTAWNYHHEWPYRAELVDWLQKTYGLRFKHYGQKGRPGVRGQDLNDLLASSKVVIGDSLCKSFKHEKYWSDRVYEITGRGGFIIHPYIRGLETQFRIQGLDLKPELTTYPYGHFDYLKGLIDFYVQNDKIRERCRDRAMLRTRRDHTYNNRMEEMLNVIGRGR